MTITIKQESEWMNNYLLLKQFITESGHIPVVTDEINGVKIGIWLRTQKKAYTNKRLTSKRESLLDNLGINFETNYPTQLNKIRCEKEISRKELAEKIGLSDDVLGKYETGYRHLESASFELNKKIAEALECDINDLHSEAFINKVKQRLNKLKEK